MINRRKRRDSNHQAIVDAFKSLGFSVIDMSQLGDAVADLMVSKGGRVIAVEIKAPGGIVTAPQASWLETWQGETAVVRSIDQVTRLASRC